MDFLITINWDSMPYMFAVAGVGFLTVFFVLVLMIGIMKVMGYFFTHQRKVKSVAPTGEVEYEDHAISDAEIVAAATISASLIAWSSYSTSPVGATLFTLRWWVKKYPITFIMPIIKTSTKKTVRKPTPATANI